MKSIALNLLNAFYAPQMAMGLLKNPRIVLYHGVTDRKSFPGIENYRAKHILQEAFKEQIYFLRSHFNIVTLKEIAEARFRPNKGARGMLAITFDDGYQNNFRVAWPILRKFDIPFTIFVPTDFVDRQEPLWVDRLEYAINKSNVEELNISLNGKSFPYPMRSDDEKIRTDSDIRSYAKTLPEPDRQNFIDEVVRRCGADLCMHLSEEPDYAPLGWDEINEMVASGLVSVGSHTAKHAIATRLETREFQGEVVDSKRIIEKRLNKKCSLFAYPNGKPQDFSIATGKVVEEAGYVQAFTTEMKFLGKSQNSLEIPRLSLDGTDDFKLFLFNISGLRMFLRRMRNFIKSGSFSSDAYTPSVAVGIEKDAGEYFDERAVEYERSYLANTPRGYSFRVRRSKIMDFLDNLNSDKKVLDIGCGPGVYTRDLLDKNFDVWGIDPSPEMIKIARDRFRGDPKTHFSVGEVKVVPFPDKYFDAVIAAGLFEYIEDINKCFVEMNRVLSPGGTFIVSFPYSASLPRLWDRVFMQPLGKLSRLILNRSAKIDSREFTPPEVKTLFEKSGFAIEDVVFYNPRLLLTPLDRLFPGFSASLSSACEDVAPRFLKSSFIIRAKRN